MYLSVGDVYGSVKGYFDICELVSEKMQGTLQEYGDICSVQKNCQAQT